MVKGRINNIIWTLGLLMAGVLGLGAMESDATTVYDHITIPGDSWAVKYGDALELHTFTTYTNSGDLQGQFTYGADGQLNHSTETLKYKSEEGYEVKKVWSVSTSKATANLYLYTYRYEGDKTFCYMDKYKNGLFDYGTSWVQSADGKTQFRVQYDSDMNMQEVECTYYDEEGRPAYILSGLSDLEMIDWSKTDIYSYEYDEKGVTTGYIQNGQNGEKVPCYRQEVVDEQVLLEMEYTDSALDTLDWYAYEKDGRVLYKITVSPAWNQAYSEIYLEHYLYAGNGMRMASYTYKVLGDISIQNTVGSNDADRSFQAHFGTGGYPTEIISKSSVTDTVVIQYDKETGALEKLTMGEE